MTNNENHFQYTDVRCLIFQVWYLSEMSNSPRYNKLNRVFISWLCATVVGACKEIYTRGAFAGYRCENGGTALRNISSIPQEKCIWQCMKRTSCMQINYNNVGNYCLLLSSSCKLALPDEEFTMLQFVEDAVLRDECLRWIPYTGTFPSDGVVNETPAGQADQLLARGAVNGGVIPGKLYTHTLQLWSVYGDLARQITNNIEYLNIHPACFGVWVPHTSGLGLDLPAGAVQGGVLTSGTPLYIARAPNNIEPGTSLGYYDPDVDLAVITVGGKRTRTQMDILVLMWSIYLNIYHNIKLLYQRPYTNSQFLPSHLNIDSPIEYKPHRYLKLTVVSLSWKLIPVLVVSIQKICN